MDVTLLETPSFRTLASWQKMLETEQDTLSPQDVIRLQNDVIANMKNRDGTAIMPRLGHILEPIARFIRRIAQS